MITQKIRTMMSEVDRHIQKKERLKAMSKIEDIVEEFNKADDITISYPTQKLHLAREERRDPPFDPQEGTV